MDEKQKTYTQEALDAAVAHAIADVNYKAQVDERLANLERMTKQANNLKRDIIDLIHKVDDGHNVKLDKIMAALDNHIQEPGHPDGLLRLEDVEEQVERFGMASIGSVDARELSTVLSSATRRKAARAGAEIRNWQLGNTWYILAILTMICGIAVDIYARTHH